MSDSHSKQPASHAEELRDSQSQQPLNHPPTEPLKMPLLAPPPVESDQPIAPHLEISGDLEKNLVRVFKLLADRNRLRILMHLVREGELHVSALCHRLNQSQPAVSHHLALLREADLIEARRDGKHNYYSVRADRFHSIIGQMIDSISEPDNAALRFGDYTLTDAG